MKDTNILAIDLAKNVFQVCKRDPKGKVLFNRELSRAKLKEMLVKQPRSLVAMEACGSAQYWARLARALGHEVKVISARTVKPFQTKQKTDRNDALAIAIAASQEHIHGARVQSAEEQALQSLERARHLAKTHQIAQSNQIRGLLGEFGIIVPPSLSQLRKHIPFILEDAENSLPQSFRETLNYLWQHLLQQIEHVAILERQLEGAVKYDTT